MTIKFRSQSRNGTEAATQVQRWFIRALARDTGKSPDEWLREAQQAGTHAPPTSHQGYLHARSDLSYAEITAPMAGRLIAWMRLGQMRPTYSPDDPKPATSPEPLSVSTPRQ